MKTTYSYGQLILKYSRNNINIFRIRLYDGHKYNWCEQLVWGGNLCYTTDQIVELGASPNRNPLTDYKEVWLDGVCIYKSPWWRWRFYV